MSFIDFGTLLEDDNPENLIYSISKCVLALCNKSKSYEVIELRSWKDGNDQVNDIIVVDCINDQVPSRNENGIKVRERLALVFSENDTPEVRALRDDFPIVPHLNHVPPGEPASLCLYFQDWQTVERQWTPQKHLLRTLWWLSKTARGTLHRDDQPLEPMYSISPFEILLPPNFEEKINDQNCKLVFQAVTLSDKDFKVLRGVFVSVGDARKYELPQAKIIQINLPEIVHGSIASSPNSLKKLNQIFLSHSIDLFDYLCKAIEEAADGGLTKNANEHCVLFLNIALKRSTESLPEIFETRAFQLNADIVFLGEAAGILTKFDGGKYYHTPIIGKQKYDTKNWHDIEIFPVEVKKDIDKEFARKASGLDAGHSDFKGVLMGVGALGSTIMNLWAKEAWGNWTIIDPDFIKAHNTIRHIAVNPYIGWYKTECVKSMVEANYPPDIFSIETFPKSLETTADSKMNDAICHCDIIVDATTTLNVPRDLSQREDIPRSCSIFVTPSGLGAVLIVEDINREIRLDSLEAQNYRKIINSYWGEKHLVGNQGQLWVGAGCRDISMVMPYETIQLSAAMLARQLRFHQKKQSAKIKIWELNDDNGSFVGHTIVPNQVFSVNSSGWKVVWDEHIEKKLNSLRNAELPQETGGIILGYIDHKMRSIYVVEILSAPYDSDADITGFSRGIHGVEDILNDVAERTANIVGYIGEWHSHPPFASPKPSSMDWNVIKTISNILKNEGQPALMIIVGSAGDISITIE